MDVTHQVLAAVFGAASLAIGYLVIGMVIAVHRDRNLLVVIPAMLALTGAAGFSVSMTVCALANMWLWLAVLISLAAGAISAWGTNDAWWRMNLTTSEVTKHRREKEDATDQTTAS